MPDRMTPDSRTTQTERGRHVKALREKYQRDGRLWPPQPWHMGSREYEAAKSRDRSERERRQNRGLRGLIRRWLDA